MDGLRHRHPVGFFALDLSAYAADDDGSAGITIPECVVFNGPDNTVFIAGAIHFDPGPPTSLSGVGIVGGHFGEGNRVDLVFRGSKSFGGDFHRIDGQPLGHGVDALDRLGQREVQFRRVVEDVQRFPVSINLFSPSKLSPHSMQLPKRQKLVPSRQI